MTKPAKILTVVGARPQFVKAAVVSAAIAATEGLSEVLVHTGQHFDADMSDVFFAELGIPTPAYNLGISGGSHGDMTGRMLMALEATLLRESPDCVLVYGDTNSTLAGALAAAKLQIPIAHVEAGLRSYNRAMPEEINRIVVDHLSRYLFCPTAQSVANLTKEGVTSGVHVVGDVMYDATLAAKRIAAQRSDIVRRLGLARDGFQLATVHRAENVDDRHKLAQVLSYLDAEATRLPVIMPVHPRTRDAVAALGLDFGRVKTIPPVGYLDMAQLLEACAGVLTDSGGLQKEAYFHRKPCVTLRDETEWVETVECGWNRLWQGPDYRPRREIADYGKGDAASRIAAVLKQAASPAIGTRGPA
ncbi:MAG TPA: UDP-N-acetylglucosamine 2-epimerase (non-hydrolyzing) [Candidatus Cybelea sp.]|nr:UDP-N-acetylglucosamine 2-epimerase (non-hydrolyzing) [Candidatus Cybelea sp.]